MPRKKHLHLAEAKVLPNLIHDPIKEDHTYFPDDKPLILELGCGKGEYTLGLAQLYPNKNFIGIDKKADRLWFGAKKALALGLTNVRFMRLSIERLMEHIPKASIAEIWLTFPDPFPRRGDAKKRLISLRFQNLYYEVLTPTGVMHLKTDNVSLFHYAREVLAQPGFVVKGCIDDIHAETELGEELNIQTTFERKHRLKGDKIHYVCWQFQHQGIDI